MIVDDFGELVWFNAIGNRELATDFRVQTYQGQPVLTWWQGRLIGGEGRGEGVIYDTSYRPVRRVRAGNGCSADLHEFELTPQGTALLLIYDAVRRDLRHVGGSRRGVVVQAVVQEIDIATGLVLFEWHSLGNIGLSESHERVPKRSGQWDYVHANSVALDGSGDFIVSARHTSSVLRISRATGRILWRLGGSRSDFRMGEGTRFWNQHDARPQPDGTLTLFDNSAPPPQREASRAITLRLDTARKTATLVQALKHPENLLVRHPGRRAAAAGRRDVRRLGLAPVLHRVRRRGPRRARRALRRRRRQLPRLQVPVERPAGAAAGARRLAAREPRRRARELERGDGGRRLGAVGRFDARTRCAGSRASPTAGSRPRSRPSRAAPSCRSGRSTPPARCSVRAQPSGPIRPRADTGFLTGHIPDHLATALTPGCLDTEAMARGHSPRYTGLRSWCSGAKTRPSNWSRSRSAASAGRCPCTLSSARSRWSRSRRCRARRPACAGRSTCTASRSRCWTSTRGSAARHASAARARSC